MSGGLCLDSCLCAMQVKESTVNIDENGVRLELTLVDTPGFGDLVDNSQWCVCRSVICLDLLECSGQCVLRVNAHIIRVNM